MRKRILIIFISFFSLGLSAQKTAKLYQKIQIAFEHRKFDEVLSISDRLPKEEKTTAQYYKLLALSFDSLSQPTNALEYYTQYLGLAKDSVCQKRQMALKDQEEKRLAAIKAKFERIKDCPKCHGTDSVSMSITCTRCLGKKIIKKSCSTCRGKGRVTCGTCAGTGIVSSGKESTACSYCGRAGTIPCPSQCDYGIITEDCRYCSDLGYVTIHVKCDRHE